MSAKTRMDPADRRRLLVYYAVACGWTWVLWIPSLVYSARTGTVLPALDAGPVAWSALPATAWPFAITFQLAVYGPLIGALFTFIVFRDRVAFGAWARSCVRVRVNWRWYAFVAAWPAALAVLIVIVSSAVAGSLPPIPDLAVFAALPLALAGQMLTSGLEEPGWRGVALPLLSTSRNAEDANWILGLIWAAWHVPYVVYLNRTAPSWTLPLTIAGFTMSLVAMTYVHAWVYYSTGSVFLNICLHAWANVTTAVAATIVAASAAAASSTGLVTAALAWGFVFWLFRRYGKERLRTARPDRF